MFSSTRNSLNTCSNFKLTVASITRRKEGGVDRKERGKEEAGGEGGGSGGGRGREEGRAGSTPMLSYSICLPAQLQLPHLLHEPTSTAPQNVLRALKCSKYREHIRPSECK